MSNPLTSRESGPPIVVGLALVLVGVIAIGAADAWWGLLVAGTGAVIEVLGVHLHDRGHRRRGEAPHAMWGANDRNRPSWLGARAGAPTQSTTGSRAANLSFVALVPLVVFILAAWGAGHTTGAAHVGCVVLVVASWIAALVLLVVSRLARRRERRARR